MITVDAVLFVSSSLFLLWDIVNPCDIYTVPYMVRRTTNTTRYSEHIYIANICTERQEPTVINVLQFWILTNIFKVFKKQKDEIHIVLNIVNSMVNLKQRAYFTFYSTAYVTTLLKPYSFWVSNAVVSLKMV
jgi:hypothetical protein